MGAKQLEEHQRQKNEKYQHDPASEHFGGQTEQPAPTLSYYLLPRYTHNIENHLAALFPLGHTWMRE